MHSKISINDLDVSFNKQSGKVSLNWQKGNDTNGLQIGDLAWEGALNDAAKVGLISGNLSFPLALTIGTESIPGALPGTAALKINTTFKGSWQIALTTVPAMLTVSGKFDVDGNTIQLPETIAGVPSNGLSEIEQVVRHAIVNQAVNLFSKHFFGVAKPPVTLLANFKAGGQGDFSFQVKMKIGPIYAPLTQLSLGSIALDTGFSGKLELSAKKRDATAELSGSFVWNKQTIELGKWSLNFANRPLSDVPMEVQSRISALASQLFAPVLSDPTAWLNAIKDGLIKGVEDVGKVLVAVHHEGAGEAAEMLKTAGITVNQSLHADRVGPHVDNALPHADRLGAHSDLQPRHNDSVTKPHADSTTPHADVPAVHIDTPATHADDVTTPHSDNTTNHNDASGQHSDAPQVHTDSVVTPHTDNSTPHTDTASIHSDTPKVHSDNVTRPHGDTATSHHDSGHVHSDSRGSHSDNHGDKPHHGDSHGDSHGHGHHGDHGDHSDSGHGDSAPHNDSTSPHSDTGASHSDAAKEHSDSVRTPHADSTSPHSDAAQTHGDTPKRHDDAVDAPHSDAPPPHSDTPQKHADADPVHSDADTTPHADEKTAHADAGGKHSDNAQEHADGTAGGHVDRNGPHIDTTPHADDSVPHTDTSSHADSN